VGAEVSRLERDSGKVGELFRELARQGHYPTGSTKQGTYLITPSGLLLSSGNSQNAGRTRRLLEESLQQYAALAREKRVLERPLFAKPARKEPPHSPLYPKDGLVLDVSLRRFFPRPLRNSPPDPEVIERSGLPLRLKRYAQTKPETYWDVAWNQDHAWFTSAEATRLLPTKLVRGERAEVDPALVRRLARLHLLDTVRALADVYPPESVEEAALSSEITELAGKLVKLRFEGKVRLAQSGLRPFARTSDQTAPVPRKPERSYEAKLLGRAHYDRHLKRFVVFELLALGKKTGGSTFSAFAETTMGVAFTLAGQGIPDRVEPRYLREYGWPGTK
jgi:hypothetical protein